MIDRNLRGGGNSFEQTLLFFSGSKLDSDTSLTYGESYQEQL